jgi:cobalamin biosynthesis Mg chelatase CobN
MRRLPSLALVCALLSMLLAGAPAFAAGTHTHHAHHTATSTDHASIVASATATTAELASSSGKATTQNGLKVLNDCQNHGQLTHVYPVAWLRKAKSMMSSDTAEYSNCSSVIQSAILHSIHGGSGGSSSSGTTTIVIIVVVVLVILAALLGVLALRRRRGGGTPPAA